MTTSAYVIGMAVYLAACVLWGFANAAAADGLWWVALPIRGAFTLAVVYGTDAVLRVRRMRRAVANIEAVTKAMGK